MAKVAIELGSNGEDHYTAEFWVSMLLAIGMALGGLALLFVSMQAKAQKGIFVACTFMGTFIAAATFSSNMFYGEGPSGSWELPVYIIGLICLITGLILVGIPSMLATTGQPKKTKSATDAGDNERSALLNKRN